MKTGYAQPMPVHNEYLVRERDRKRARESLMVILLVVAVLAPMLGYTWLRHQVRETGFRIDVTERRLMELRTLERRLELQVTRAESPQRLESRATQELGLVAPKLDQMIFTNVRDTP